MDGCSYRHALWQAMCRAHGGKRAVNVGLTEWIADSPEKFIEIGVAPRAMLAVCRVCAELRTRMATSPLCDAATFTHTLEQTYRSLWRRWCDQGSR